MLFARTGRSPFAAFVVTAALVCGVCAGAGAPAWAKPVTYTQQINFARCIARSGAKFYGAHWCSYCHKQKAMFGKAASYLPYIECYKAGTRDKLGKCEHIDGVPRWIFADGSVGRGLKSFEQLAAATGCSAP